MGGGASGGVSGIDVAGAAPRGWWAALALGGKLYGVPCNAESLLVYDPASSAGGTAGAATKLAASGEGKWRSAVAMGGKIYGIPDRAEHLLTYEIATGRISGVPTSKVARGKFKWQAAVALGGKVYGIPHDAEKLLVYDPATGQVSGVQVTSIATGPAKWVAGLALDGKLFGVPCNAPSILVYDPVIGRVSSINASHIATGPLKWLTATVVGGKLYCIPCHADCILAYDPVADKLWGVSTSSVSSGPGKWMSSVAIRGKVYGIPDHADALLVYDPSTNGVSGVDISKIASGPTKWQCGAALNGRLYAVPFNADQILVYDPATGEASGVDVGGVASGPGKWGTAVVFGGRLFGVPYDAPKLLVYEPVREHEEVEHTENVPLKIGQELVEDFVAAWLSEWVYQLESAVDPTPVPPLGVDGEAIEFSVRHVYEEPLQGSPARLALVVAAIPKVGRVLFVVFKGSSFLTDFITNASVSPDYTPFNAAFGDQSTFVHHGAHHAIAQIRVHQWGALHEQLRRASDEGVGKLLVTGHSLGGQYALAFLLHAYLDRVPAQHGAAAPEPPSPLLEGARVVVFGAPMCFGVMEGAAMRGDFVEFVRGRSVNYMHAGDPAPRLWSELDLEGFMQYFVGWIQSQISGFATRLVDYAAGPGGLAKRAEELLARGDIESQLLQPAKQYVHLSRVRVLLEEFRPWRPLGREYIKLDDHSMRDGYIPALRAAFDPSGPMHLFSEDGRKLIDEGGHGLA